MSNGDETVMAMPHGSVYHTDETCYRITDRAREWDLDEALKAGRYECGHCQADEQLGSKQCGEQMATKLSNANPEDLGLSPMRDRGGRADD